MLGVPLNKGVKPSTKPTLTTQTHQLHYLISRTLFSDSITSYRKTSVVLKLSNFTFAEFFT